MITYVTFGQDHRHVIDDKVFDKDCVAAIQSGSPQDGRALAFEYFGRKFCFEYPEQTWDMAKMMTYFRRGIIPINF